MSEDPNYLKVNTLPKITADTFSYRNLVNFQANLRKYPVLPWLR